MRSGDTLTVRYESEAECSDVRETVEWLQSIVAELKWLPRYSSPADHPARDEEAKLRLSETLFHPWESPVKQMNKCYFVRVGGLDALLQIYSFLLDLDWEYSNEALRSLEYCFLRSIYCLASTFSVRCVLIEKGVVDLCLGSFLRVPSWRGGEFTVRNCPQREMMLKVIACAMATLCK